jgi:hypothetical protein
MKEQFPGYYRPSLLEFQELWDNCLFSLDANVLLNIYGYSEETRQVLLALLESLAARLRMPYQFAEEYHRNRARVIMEQVKNYARAEKILADLYKEDLEPKHKHPFLSKSGIKAFKRIQKDLSDSRKRHEALFSSDPYADRIANILKHVGEKPTDLDALHEKAKLRHSCKIPPGYADEKDKPLPNAYGDCIGWLQIIEIAKAEKKLGGKFKAIERLALGQNS